MKLSVLIATQGRRERKFKELVKELSRQAEQYPRQVEVVAYWNNGELPIGTIRQALLENARGDYVCFVDDDDKVPEYYLKEILGALGEDYVGFKVKLFNDGVEQRPSYHDLQYQVWTEDDNGFYRGVTHLNPIRRAIAVEGSFDDKGAGEDARWAAQVVKYVRTQNYIDKFMYFYHHSRHDTSFSNTFKDVHRTYYRPELGHKYFRYHPYSKLTSKEVQNVKSNNRV